MKHSGVRWMKLRLMMPRFWYARLTFTSTCWLNYIPFRLSEQLSVLDLDAIVPLMHVK